MMNNKKEFCLPIHILQIGAIHMINYSMDRFEPLQHHFPGCGARHNASAWLLCTAIASNSEYYTQCDHSHLVGTCWNVVKGFLEYESAS